MLDSSLAFHELSFVPEGDEVMVGCAQIDSYALFPPDGARLLQRMYEGESPDAAARWYEQMYGETVALNGFLETLADLGFLRGPEETSTGAERNRLRWQRLARALFSPAAWCAYAALVAAAVVVAIRCPAVRPRPRNLFFTDSLVVVQLVFLACQLPAIALHESFHTLAGRRLGLPAKLSVDRRLYYVVFETRLPGLLGLPRRSRYLPLLAGMLADVLWYAGLTVMAAAVAHAGGMPWYGKLPLAIAYPTLLRLLWQFYVVLQTDLYYVASTALGCVDLHAATQARLRNMGWRLLRKPHRLVDESRWSGRDRSVARWYAPIAATMTVLLIGVAVAAVLPVLVHFGGLLADEVSQGGLGRQFWDATVSLALTLGTFVVAAALSVRDRLRTRADRRSHAGPTGAALLFEEPL